MATAAHRFPDLLLALAVLAAPGLTGLALPGCDGAQDVGGTTGTTSGFEAPDITGSYVVTWDVTGCTLPSDWVAGDLAISGDAADLTWDFGEAAFPGSVDGTFAFELSGDATVDAVALSLDGSGTAYIDTDDSWALDGDLSLASSAGPSCDAAFGARVAP